LAADGFFTPISDDRQSDANPKIAAMITSKIIGR
jgi:hypothetical protein